MQCWTLERGIDRSSGSVVCDARAEKLEARAETCFCESSGSVYPPLERESVSDARAGRLTLERGDWV